MNYPDNTRDFIVRRFELAERARWKKQERRRRLRRALAFAGVLVGLAAVARIWTLMT